MGDRRVQVALAATLTFVLLLITGLSYSSATSTQRKLSQTRNDLALARQNAAEAAQKLSGMDQNVVEVNNQLKSIQANLATANATIDKQKGDIAASKECLDGVTNAVVSGSTHNAGEAQTILDGAKTACARAYPAG